MDDDDKREEETDGKPLATPDRGANKLEDRIAPHPRQGGYTIVSAFLKNLCLSKTEKICLGSLAAIIIGLMLWGILWLSGQKNLGTPAVELPVTGEYATITHLSTVWITPPEGSGVNLDAVIVPTAVITLDPDSKATGALRLYFQNAAREIVGDPMTLPIRDGKFSDGSHRTEIIATDGFHSEGQFFAYQKNDSTPWRLVILEARDASVAGSEFNELIDAPLEANRR